MSPSQGLTQQYADILARLRAVAGVHYREGRLDDALRMLRYAEQIAAEADVVQADRANVLTHMGTMLAEQASFSGGAFDEAVDVLDRAVETAKGSGDTRAGAGVERCRHGTLPADHEQRRQF